MRHTETFFTELKDNEYYFSLYNRFIAGVPDNDGDTQYKHLNDEEKSFFKPYRKKISSLNIFDFEPQNIEKTDGRGSMKTTAELMSELHQQFDIRFFEKFKNGYIPAFEDFKILFCTTDYHKKVYDSFIKTSKFKELVNIAKSNNDGYGTKRFLYESGLNERFRFLWKAQGSERDGWDNKTMAQDTISQESKEMARINDDIVSRFCLSMGFPYKPTMDEYIRFLKHNKKTMHFKIQQNHEESYCLIWKVLKMIFPENRINRNTFKTHTYIVGQSGSGKSELLKTIFSKLSSHCILIDPHGDLADSIQKSGALVIAPHEKRFVVNPFDIDDKSLQNRELVAQEIQNLMSEMMADSNLSALMGTISFPIISTLLKLPYADFAMFADCIQPTQEGREKLEALEEHADPHYKRIWASLCNDTYETTKRSIFNRLQSFLNKKIILDCTSGKDDLGRHLRNTEESGGNIVISLSIPAMGEQVSEVLGRFFMTRLQIFARRREAIPENKRVPFFLIVDEAQNFLSKETARTLDQFGRKFGLFMILANQHIRQIEDTQLKGSILANCKNKIVGMSDKATRQALAGEMGLDYTDFEDLKTGTFFGKFNSIEPLKFYSPLTRDLDLGINKRFAYSQNSGEWVDGWEKAGMKKTIMGNTETGKTDKIKPKYDL